MKGTILRGADSRIKGGRAKDDLTARRLSIVRQPAPGKLCPHSDWLFVTASLASPRTDLFSGRRRFSLLLGYDIRCIGFAQPAGWGTGQVALSGFPTRLELQREWRGRNGSHAQDCPAVSGSLCPHDGWTRSADPSAGGCACCTGRWRSLRHVLPELDLPGRDQHGSAAFDRCGCQDLADHHGQRADQPGRAQPADRHDQQ
jgi:hypothetical protein